MRFTLTETKISGNGKIMIHNIAQLKSHYYKLHLPAFF